MPSAIIADDEDLPRSELRRLLAQVWPALNVLAECEHGADALEVIGRLQPDIAFLDIRMPGLSGLDVARVAGSRCRVVFVTAYDEHAFDAFEAGAIDYLRKPVERARLEQTCGRLRERLGQPPADVGALMMELDRRLRGSATRVRWISASVADTIRIIPIDDVLYFRSDEKYTRVVTVDDEALVRTPLRELVEGLDPDQFWQVHRGTVVRAAAISRIKRDELGKITIALKERPELLKASQAYAWRFRPM
ncbi:MULTISPECIES: LytTR family DNA-binding domain-containing protein [unclassified Massilia]|uniref:LytR/AlgR family response regulator transcription factor n=1 Tax=unclassified Massilia TaxID=2609279 RepID=UPI001786E85A|nr:MULTISPECIES: LytTR family DNA-binding domain-containing protein [unclassified Massilia]MBD8529781.1 response regulator transcription factor [Massilia sp. CFBP 13647]MBD8672207.1 response regulator transcription factor [Massilia sp. CFBP 13721]